MTNIGLTTWLTKNSRGVSTLSYLENKQQKTVAFIGNLDKCSTSKSIRINRKKKKKRKHTHKRKNW